MCAQYMLLHPVHMLYYADMTSPLDSALVAGTRLCPAALFVVSGALTLGGGPSVYWPEGFGLVLLHSITMTVPATVRGV